MQSTSSSKKVLIIGASSVGKTSILIRFLFGKFDENSMPTTQGAFKTKRITVKDSLGEDQVVCLNLWDTAGQERYEALTKMYFLNAHAALIVYDVTDRLSFEKCQKWVQFLDDFNGDRKPGILKYLVGNKRDMDD